MKKRRNLIISLLLVAAIALGVGYAAVTSLKFDIDGRTSIEASDANYHVYFDPTIVASDKAVGEVLSDLKASMNAINTLENVGDTAYVTYQLCNDENSLYDAKITGLTINKDQNAADGDSKYFDITVEGIDTENPPVLQPGESMEVTVKVTLFRTALENKSTALDITFNAEPVEIILGE